MPPWGFRGDPIVFVLMFFVTGVTTLCAARCRVDDRQINAGVVAMGESPADRIREISLIPR